MSKLKFFMACVFSGFFIATTFALVCLMASHLVVGLILGDNATMTLLRAISTAVVALATFELGVGIHREYPVDDGHENVYSNVRRTTTRFLGTSCVALVLEALIMVIKYSQLDLAGNLYYPVSIILGAAALLVALGLFLFLTRHTGTLSQAVPVVPANDTQVKVDR